MIPAVQYLIVVNRRFGTKRRTASSQKQLFRARLDWCNLQFNMSAYPRIKDRGSQDKATEMLDYWLVRCLVSVGLTTVTFI